MKLFEEKEGGLEFSVSLPCVSRIPMNDVIIDTLRSNGSSPKVLLYFYFAFSDTDKQSLQGMLRSLIGQLYHSQLKTRGFLDQLFRTYHSGNQQPTTESLCAVLKSMIRQIGDVAIVIDALDKSRTKEELLD